MSLIKKILYCFLNLILYDSEKADRISILEYQISIIYKNHELFKIQTFETNIFVSDLEIALSIFPLLESKLLLQGEEFRQHNPHIIIPC